MRDHTAAIGVAPFSRGCAARRAVRLRLTGGKRRPPPLRLCRRSRYLYRVFNHTIRGIYGRASFTSGTAYFVCFRPSRWHGPTEIRIIIDTGCQSMLQGTGSRQGVLLRQSRSRHARALARPPLINPCLSCRKFPQSSLSMPEVWSLPWFIGSFFEDSGAH
jgi:hypothetical protein